MRRTGDIGGGAGVGAVSGASRFGLASASGGGAPSELRRFSFVRSAMIFHLVDKGLDKSVGLGIEAGIAGFGDGVAGVLGLAEGRLFGKETVERRVSCFGNVSPCFPLFRRRADVVQGKNQFL